MRINIRSLLPFFVIIGAFLVIGAVLITSGVLPEERAQYFRSLEDVTIASDMKVLNEPTLGDNTFIYAVNDVAQRGIDIAQADARVRQILDDAKAKQATVTIAAVQPTVMVDRQSGESSHSPAGQVVITSNWQTIGGTAYPEPQSFAAVADQGLESHQQIWHVLVDVDSGQVRQVNQQANRVLSDTINPEVVRTEVNMFMPNAIVVDAGSTVRWINPSNLPHNVVGIFNQTTAQDAVNSTGLIVDNSTNGNNNNTNANDAQPSPQSSSGAVAVDSGFIQQGQSWQYSFNEAGVFNYLCTIHAEEGMRGTLIIAAASAS
ncbi:MAG: plastocyanin/azurin family copper-binding protein [Thermoproteota archaeon]|jgi:plastocyanin|nr:plastocyanin/azurin family copper-binding protein [Thermoproteota archaeon]